MFEFIAVIILMAFVFLFWFIIIKTILRIMKKTNGKPTHKAVRPSPSNEPESLELMEGESAESHAAHLMVAAQEGESEEEHAIHLQKYDLEEERYESSIRNDDEMIVAPDDQPHTDSASRAYALRRAVVTREILDAPVSLRDPRF